MDGTAVDTERLGSVTPLCLIPRQQVRREDRQTRVEPIVVCAADVIALVIVVQMEENKSAEQEQKQLQSQLTEDEKIAMTMHQDLVKQVSCDGPSGPYVYARVHMF